MHRLTFVALLLGALTSCSNEGCVILMGTYRVTQVDRPGLTIDNALFTEDTLILEYRTDAGEAGTVVYHVRGNVPE